MSGWSGMRPSEFVEVIEANAKTHVKAIVVDVLQAVVLGSPVDTSAYRSNHRVSINEPDMKYDDAARGSPQDAISRGAAVMAGIKSPYGEFLIQNNLSYAAKLEQGSSQQAPYGVYEPAFRAAKVKYVE